MMRFKNVPEPAGFQTAVNGKGSAARPREGAGAMMQFKNAPEPAGFQTAVNGDSEYVMGREPWKRFKSDLARATFGKCGYCEVNVVAVDRFKGDVEHYRPKGRVDRLVVGPDGKVTPEPLFTSGYHWLAYSWSNYILTCNLCNSVHKQNYFPLKTEPAAAPKEGDELKEDALLLNPFGRKDPAKHLVFNCLGMVLPRKGSVYGTATIAVCGLSREWLTKKRSGIAGLTQRCLDVFGDPDASAKQIDWVLQFIADVGRIDREHCGMVRGMFTEATGLPWSFVEKLEPRSVPEF